MAMHQIVERNTRGKGKHLNKYPRGPRRGPVYYDDGRFSEEEAAAVPILYVEVEMLRQNMSKIRETA